MIQDGKETFMDLLAPVYKTDYSPQGRVIIVNQYYVSRPDLISLAVYGDDKYGDIICKLNGISNPFELNENDLLFVPAIDDINQLVSKNDTASKLVDESDELSPISNKVDLRKKYSEKRAPNELTIDKSNYIIDKSLGLVFY
jgi:hypothetical protein